MTANEKLEEAGFEDVRTFSNYSYDDALVGVTSSNQAVYDFDKMVKFLMEKEGLSEVDATEWIYYNTIRSLPYFGPDAPIIMYSLGGDE